MYVAQALYPFLAFIHSGSYFFYSVISNKKMGYGRFINFPTYRSLLSMVFWPLRDLSPTAADRRGALYGAELQRIESIPDAEVFTTGNSYLGHVRQASHPHRDLALLCRALLKRGHAVEGRHLSKVFRKAQ